MVYYEMSMILTIKPMLYNSEKSSTQLGHQNISQSQTDAS